MITLKHRIISNIDTDLRRITNTNGFDTNIGQTVYSGKLKLEDDECPVCTIIPGMEELVDKKYGKATYKLPVNIIGCIQLRPKLDPVSLGELVCSDILIALTSLRIKLRFSTGTSEIKSGDTITGLTTGSIGRVYCVTVTSGSWASSDAAGFISCYLLEGRFEAENIDGATILEVSSLPRSEYAHDIQYIAGGVPNYPASGETILQAVVSLAYYYQMLVGNPYQQ